MTKQDLLSQMSDLGACSDAVNWVSIQDGTAQEIWDRCERGDWMLWYAAKAKHDAREVGMAACLCAREALPYVPAGEDRPRVCIETTERWCNGTATIDEVKKSRDAYAARAGAASASAAAAADAAYSAAASADAAAAADAAYSAAASADAAAARAAAACSADAAYSAAAAADARKMSLTRSAELVRTIIATVPGGTR
jgi:hypothetical protein